VTRTGERGFTLAETLVTATLAALVLVFLLSIHGELTIAYRRSVEAAGLQQNARVAMRRLVEELRLAGLDIDPDADPNRQDEALEGAWESAVTIRADLDSADPAGAAVPESSLGGSGMPLTIVTTGNDEVVTWALGRSSGGGSTLVFEADVVGTPRDGTVEPVPISRVHTGHHSPPYTLYRMTVTPDGTGVVRRPVAEGMASLTYTYYDADGGIMAPAGGADDPASTRMRARVAAIGISLTAIADGPSGRAITIRTRVALRAAAGGGGLDLRTEQPGNPAHAR